MLRVLYEDNHIIVVEKPHNIPTQEDETKDKDMLSLVKEYVKEKYNKTGNVYIGLVHRLDRPTGGVMVFARTSKAASRLSEQIRNHTLTKTYLTVTVGTPKERKYRLINYLLKNEKTNRVSIVPQLTTGAKEAILDYEVIESYKKYSLIKVNLITGRSHQIRVQFKNIGCPVFGDMKYGGEGMVKGYNLALWCYELKFEHPTTREKMTFKAYPNEEQIPWKDFKYTSL